jgi:chaperonin cofactor prefoldin
MNAQHPSDPLDDPEYLRGESRRFRKVVETLSNPNVKKELASHSLNLAQRAEAISRIQEDPAITRMNIERYRSVLQSAADHVERQTIQEMLSQSERALKAHDTLRELAAWYRSFAERAGNPVIWEARLQTAEDLEAEAERIEQRNAGG